MKTFMGKDFLLSSPTAEKLYFDEYRVICGVTQTNATLSEDGNIYAEIDSKSFGFVHKKNKEANIVLSNRNNSLTFNVIEPHGVIYKNNSLVTLYLPANTVIDLAINNTFLTPLLV